MYKAKFKKITLFILIILISFSFTLSVTKKVEAQALVFDSISAAWQAGDSVWQKFANAFRYAYDKGGAIAFQQTLRSALNKIAIDSATWIASGDKGQRPLFITEGTGAYFASIADEAAGQFIESFVNNWNLTQQDSYGSSVEGMEACMSQRDACLSNIGAGFMPSGDTTAQEHIEQATNRCLQEYNRCTGTIEAQTRTTARPIAVCQPSSLDVKLRISLGLVEHVRPRAPTCTASDLVRNWSDEISRLDPRTWDDRDYINRLTGIFHPTQSDLGIALNIYSDIEAFQTERSRTAELDWMESGRWLDVIGISGSVESLPGQAQMEAQIAQEGRMATLFTHSGDAFIDAANIFINTLALQYYNRLMQGFGKTVDEFQSVDLTDPDIDPSIRFGDVRIEEKISQILAPAFSQQADYNIVSDLSLCPDPSNPRVTDCVIDTSFMQAVVERKTVIEAIKDGSLRANWLLTTDNSKGKDNAYTLRNISILRKHRILPIGWEIAAKLNENKGATLLDLVSCFDIDDDYQEFSSSFDLRDTAWCQGLIDPYWVLKAPLSFCAKQGIGGQILNKQILAGQSGIPNSPDIPSRLSVTRDDSYCADGLTCIREDFSTGACLAYGYCNEEKRIWTFDYPSCQPVYNTCTAFTDPQGSQIAYLENTLDYGVCSEENAGCLPYYTRGNYDLASGRINWETSPLKYFNNRLANCSAQNEGCTELMRVRPAWGSNLIMGADFEYDEIGDNSEGSGLVNDYWPIDGNGVAEIVDGAVAGFSGRKILRMQTDNSTISLYSNNNNSLLPDNFPLIPGYSYTLSADVYIQSGSGVKLTIGDDDTFSQTTTSGSWQRLFQTYHLDVNTPQISSLEFNIENLGNGAVFYLRNIKLEISSWANSYSPYGSFKIYQKLIPQYLENVCYQDVSSATKDYRLRDDAPSICNDFARRCNIDEVGCVMLTSEKHNISIPAQPVTSDYCPRECEDYNVYVAQASHFYNSHAENLIPYNSRVCSANFVGCTEFTNLDDVASGGERREYYTHLKHCIKPDENRCANFYTWEGDDESGYQLRVMSLEKDGEHPKLTSSDTSCTATTYNLSPFHPDFNPDCRQFYNQAGQVSYRLMSKTITCSENCHTYRITQNNVDNSLNQAECVGDDKNWNNELNHCYVCKNNGVWSNTHNACLYQAIPGEGKTCNASMVGCREYSGSDGSNVRMVAAYDFQTGSAGWTGYCGHGVQTSNVSVSQNGRSLWYQTSPVVLCTGDEPNEGIGINLGYNLRQNKSYTIRFLARAGNSDAQVEFLFANTDNDLEDIQFFPESITVKAGAWQIYELNLPNFNRSVDMDEHLIIKSNADFYIDNISIKEVSDRFYLISNTSQIPDICYYDILDNYQGADYNLGCSRWTDNSGNTHFLRKISKLCHESSVGCELMIDTNNSSDWRNKTICDSITTCIQNELTGEQNCFTETGNCVDVAGDKFIAAIHDRTKVCLSDNKGCVRMGQIIGEGSNQLINTVYKKNNPENYSNSLCSEEAVACQEWRTDSGFQYFKDPRENACVYRHVRDSDLSSSIKHWFMKDVKRCDLGNNNFGNICSDDNDCPGACVLDQTDYPCAVSYFETIGLGGLMGRVPTPSMQAGICDLEASGCTEYIDLVSQFSPNLVVNPSYQGDPVEAWGTEEGIEDNEQIINLIPNTLYLFTATDSGVELEFEREARLFQLNNNRFSNTVIGEEEEYTIRTASANNNRIYFHSQLNETAIVKGGAKNRTITVKPIIVDYQLKQNIDYESCNGLVNFNNGCVLFNERSFNGANGISQLNLDAFGSETNSPPKSCFGNNCTANQLIKVNPDRICGRWLDCRTYIDDPETGERTCYDLGECAQLNDQNECINFTSFKDEDDEPIVFNYFEHSIHNITGYSLLDHYYIGEMYEVGLNTSVHYDFETTNIALHCEVGIKPLNHDNYPDVRGSCNFDNNIVADSLIIEPDKAITDYPAQGRGYLKVLAYYQMAPHSQNETFQLIDGQDYYIHFLLNTKDAGINGIIMLYDFDSKEVVWQRPASAHGGWERKIFKIDTNEINSDSLNSLQIFLTADTNNLEERYVYFDDIHIEPVLKVGPDKYVARDCRLYPETDSLSCSSSSDNIIRHGLEGYCLQRDPINNNVCLTWYPVDQISSSQLTSTVGGYQGKQPLYYCAEADGNFELLEKRVANFVGKAYWRRGSGVSGGGNNMPNSHWMQCYDGTHTIEKYGIRLTGRCCEAGYINDDGTPNKMVQTICGGDNNYVAVAGQRDGDHQDKYFFCIPKASESWINSGRIKLTSEWKTIEGQEHSNCLIEYRDVWGTYDGFTQVTRPSDFYKNQLGATNFKTACKEDDYDYSNHEVCRNLNEFQSYNPPIAVYDYNNPPLFEEYLKFINHDNIDKVYQPVCNRFVQLVDPYGVNKAWVGRVSRSSDPYLTPIWMTKSIKNHDFYDEDFILEGDYGCQFKGGNYPNCQQEKLCNDNPDCFWSHDYGWEYNSGELCECGDFKYDGCSLGSQVCNEEEIDFGAQIMCRGHNINYCFNITDPEVCNSNEYCEYVDPDFDQLEPFIRYGQNREDVPFGAAILPENFNFYSSLPVPFRNQYSDRNNQSIFAGRPYGCDGAGCKNLGQCSLNPNVYCIHDPSNFLGSSKINADSCAKGGYGTCTPLWQGDYKYLTSSLPHFFFEFPLRTLFLKSFGGFEFNYQEEGGYKSAKGYDCAGGEDYYNADGDTCAGGMLPCNGPRPNYENEDESSWCVIYPEIQNVDLFKVGEDISIPINTNGNVDITETGLYYLQFNSIVDIEQQPLRQIEINWGDGNFQVLPNQGHRPNTDRPHRIYHFYSTSNIEDFNIKLIDNWGSWRRYLELGKIW